MQAALSWYWHPDTPLLAEWRWTPSAGEWQSIHGLERPHTAAQYLAARRWLGLIKEDLGRPKTAQEQAQKDLLSAMRRAVDAGCPARKVRRADLAVQLGIGERQVGNKLGRAQWSMVQLIDEFERRSEIGGV